MMDSKYVNDEKQKDMHNLTYNIPTNTKHEVDLNEKKGLSEGK